MVGIFVGHLEAIISTDFGANLYNIFRAIIDCLCKQEQSLGISGTLLKWIHSFLTCRFQRVTIRSSHSSWLPVSSCVPQGSVLGPLLFLL